MSTSAGRARRAAAIATPFAAALLATAPAARAIDPAIKVTVVVIEGQPIAGVGTTTQVGAVAVNDSGTTLVEIDTNNPNQDIDGAVLRDGQLVLQEGLPLTQPPGAVLDGFSSLNLNDIGNSAWILHLANTGSAATDSGLYRDLSLLVQESAGLTVPNLTVGTPVIAFDATRVNDANNVMLRCTIDDPALAGGPEDVLLARDVFGNFVLIAAEKKAPPPLAGVVVEQLPSGAATFDISDVNDVIWSCDTTGAADGDERIFMNGVVLATEGAPSVVPGRNWGPLFGARVSLNRQSDHAFAGSLGGDPASGGVLVKDAKAFVQKGAALPSFAPAVLTGFGDGPIVLSDRGAPDEDPDLMWFGAWNGSDAAADTALFLETVPLLREGVDVVAGQVIDELGGGAPAAGKWGMSDSGRYVVANVALGGGLDAAVRLDFGPWTKLGKSKQVSTRPKLRGFGPLTSNSTVTARFSNGKPGGVAHVVIGTSRIDLPIFGGTLVPSPDIVVFDVPIDANGEITVTGTIAPGIAPGSEFFVQFWSPDGATMSCSNAIRGVTQ